MRSSYSRSPTTPPAHQKQTRNRNARTHARTHPTGVAGLLKGATTAVELLRDWLDDGGVVYIPVISEMFKLATGQDLQLGKAAFFLIAIPTTYGVKALTGKFPSEVSWLTGREKSSVFATAGELRRVEVAQSFFSRPNLILAVKTSRAASRGRGDRLKAPPQ